MTVHYLSLGEIAQMLGVEASTVRRYRSEGRLPEPDVMIGSTPGWTKATIQRWNAARPGQGGRPPSKKRRVK